MKDKLKSEGLFNMGGSIKKNDYVDENVTEIVDNVISVNDSVSVNKNKKAHKNVYKNENIDDDKGLSLSFARKPRRRKPVPMTYRLYPETIEKIDDLAMKSGMYVSEFLQAVLDRVLDEIKIE